MTSLKKILPEPALLLDAARTVVASLAHDDRFALALELLADLDLFEGDYRKLLAATADHAPPGLRVEIEGGRFDTYGTKEAP